MAVLLGSHPAFLDHDTGTFHPESAARLKALRDGIAQAHLEEVIAEFEAPAASRADLERVHSRSYLDELEQFCHQGGGHIDADTVASEGTFAAAVHAAGAGLEAVERLRRGDGDAAFLAVRPPGHHALAQRAMGFCVINSIAVTAAALVERGERVVILDWDAHHGNGTQELFYRSAAVLFISMHQYPLFPGTGSLEEVGEGEGLGMTINLPFPSGTTGDIYRFAFDELVVPAVERFSPTWLLVSAGFDGHRRDPLTELGLSSGDFADLTRMSAALVQQPNRIFFLEGGYDHDGVAFSGAACVAALGGLNYRPEEATSGPSDATDRDGLRTIVERACLIHDRVVEA